MCIFSENMLFATFNLSDSGVKKHIFTKDRLPGRSEDHRETCQIIKRKQIYSLWMLVYKRTGDISPVSHMNKHKCIMNVHYLAIATVITFPGARRENSLSQNVQTQEWENTLQWVPLEAEYNNNKKRKQSIQMTNVIFGMQTLYKYIIIGFQHWLAKRTT